MDEQGRGHRMREYGGWPRAGMLEQEHHARAGCPGVSGEEEKKRLLRLGVKDD